MLYIAYIIKYMKSTYPNKYCDNCKEITERYSKGNCKSCVKRRTKDYNKLRDLAKKELSKSVSNSNIPKFNIDSYKKVTIESIIKDTNRNRNCFIYFLIKDDNLVYVGKSNNGILGRINSHIKNKEFDAAYYTAISSEKLLDEYEKRYIVKYRPKYNKVLFYKDVKVDILDLKTLEVHSWNKHDLVENTGCKMATAEGFFRGNRLKLYNKYILECNRQQQHTYKEILDTHTNTVERHSLISFAEKVGVKQNNVWYFFNGCTKSFQKKRYVLFNSKQNEVIELS